MFNASSSAFFVTLFLFTLGGESVCAPPPPTGKPAAPQSIPGIARMNPYYLGISAAVLANDTKALSDYVNELEKVASSHPDSWMDAMCARLYVLEQLDDRDRFSQAMAQLCAPKLPDKQSLERRLKFVSTTLLTLRMSPKAEWVGRAADAAWPVLGPEPDPLLVRILRERLERMSQYDARAILLEDTLQKASKFLKEAPSDHALQAYWTSGMEELQYLSIRNHFSAMKLDPLTSEVTAYLDKFGKDGRHAAAVFHLQLKALNVYYTQIAKSERTLIKPPNPEWLQRWHQEFSTQKGGGWAKNISEEWTKWESGARAREELFQQPQKNPKLEPRLSLKLTRPRVNELINQLNIASGLQFSVAENIPEDRVVCGYLLLHGVHAWSLMDRIKQEVISDGQWEPIIVDHQVTGYKLTGTLKPLPPSLAADASRSSEASPSDPATLGWHYFLFALPILAIFGIMLLVRYCRRFSHAGAVRVRSDAPKLPFSA